MQWNLVPQVFYDVVARIMPGFVSIIAWYLVILGPNQAIYNLTTDQKILNLGSFTWLVTFSYVLGFILKESWNLTLRKLKQKTTVKQNSIEQCNKHRECLKEPKLPLKSQNLPATHVMHDYVRIYLPSEGARLLKLRAERDLCGALFTGLFLLPVVNALLWYLDHRQLASDRVFLEMITVAALVALWTANSRFQKFYKGGTCTSWLLLCFPVDPLKQKLAGKPGGIQIKNLTFRK